MDFGHQGGDPAHVEVLVPRAASAGTAFCHVALDRRMPEALVGHIDGEFGCFLRNPQRRVGENKLSMARSRVKPWTPLPVVSTSMVFGP